ncbi:MAG: 16S rRNA (uracil(1498)-N(3))-methyltransferase [Micromonosporaceae bacterium]|nr:16S rRNA (uracil(1498)-N(3))-methyltransferase [Micromonosporaceae bacterium]
MTDPLFLVDHLPSGTELSGALFRLDGPEGRHAADVARLKPGQRLLVSDGAGAVASAVVLAAHRGALDVEITDRRRVDRPDPTLTVVQGIAKGDRGELAVQAMSEVGVDEIVPWAARRSVVVWRGERGERACERWRSTAREASKQARRAWVPAVSAAESTAAVEGRLRAAAGAFVLHEEARQRLATVGLPAAGAICLVVGPEGGIDGTELAQFAEAGAVPVRLGPTVLRTSTAGVAAISVLSTRLGRW